MAHSKIATFAVIDLETNGLPDLQFNKCSITELSIIAFSSEYEEEKQTEGQSTTFGKEDHLLSRNSIPELPRALHKLSLMVNPLGSICPEAEKETGLNNWMLEHERPFDKGTADLLISFLQRLQQPVCLVAHNGLGFDFPVLRYVMKKLDLKFPSSILCVDSWKAFEAIDADMEMNNYNNNEMPADIENANEDVTRENDNEQRIFQEDFNDLHRAENDVVVLSKLILHYGLAFIEYANSNALSLNDVPSLDERKT
uniref:Exonuclease domain-containing protein n=1 Tax=Glossina austeni TaxID=7395 RepID=A0A1A9V1B6_GLOAU